MKKIILSILFLCSIVVLSTAQNESRNKEESRKRIEASKVAYMTTYLDLSSSEAEKFWPIYNEYQNKRKALRGERGERKSISEMSDSEASTRLDNYITRSSKKTALQVDYMNRARTVLSDKKVLMLIKAEDDFRKQMVKKYAERKRSKGDSNPNKPK